MIRRTTTASIILGACLLLSCSQKSANDYEASEVSEMRILEDEVAPLAKESTENVAQPNFISSLAASTQQDDGIHKFIRTAEMKFRVKNVPLDTYIIEDIIIKNQGFIILSAISNQNSYSTTTNISKDSALVTYHSSLVADLKLRVPRAQLDTILKQIAPLALEIDYRRIDANDITLQLLSDKLKQERLAKKGKRVSDAIGNKGQKLENIMDAEEILDNTLEEADRAKLNEYSINDQIEYSTITISLYQNPSVYKEKILREKSVEEYEAGLGEKAMDALYNGWIIICSLFIFLLNIWPLILIGVIVGIVYFKYKKNRN